MKKNCNWKKKLALCLAIVMMFLLPVGCGKEKTPEDYLADMKEFSTPDGSASIYLDKNWETQDAGVDYWLCAGSGNGNDILFLMQFPKRGLNKSASSMDEMKASLKESYSISGETQAEAPEVSAMENVNAETAEFTLDGRNIGAYLVYGETDYAYYTLMFASLNMKDSVITAAKASCLKFAEQVPEEEDATTVEITDTVRWFNASYAVLTEVNGWDYNRFAGLAANEESKVMEQESLKEWWGVTDRASADENLDWILTEGHRTSFADEMDYLKQGGFFEMDDAGRTAFLEENFNITSEQVTFYAQYYPSVYEAYEKNGANAVAAWDYCRAMNLLSFYYLAGYYTEAETLDKSLEIAQTMQPLFSSWDEMIESYMCGYEYWAEESSSERRAIYEDLKGRTDNPYAVDYNLTLEKTW